MKRLAALLLLASAALLWLRHENQTLNHALIIANQTAAEQKQTLVQLTTRLATQDSLNRQNAAAEQAWRQQLAAAEQQAVHREQTIARLINENDTFRHWYNTALPDAVRRVHQRSACASAGHCQPALPDGHAVSHARE
jgi:LysB family phage lysis regulatory protein